MLIQKFGGTSVATCDRIEQVAARVARARSEGTDVVAVVSAMAGETDRLLGLTRALDNNAAPREVAAACATGEQVSAALLAIALNKRGCPAASMNATQVPIRTDGAHLKARIAEVGVPQLRAQLDAGVVPVVAGFQGIADDGTVTTLGRGGSDTTAVALAAALGAAECQIYTDVDGVYTADPRIVSNARRLAVLTYEEMLELASLGSKVLQIRSVEFASKYEVPVRVLSSFADGPGTLITREESALEAPKIAGIAYNRDEAQLTVLEVPDSPGAAYKVLGPVSDANIEVDMIVQNVARNGLTDLTFTVHRTDFAAARAILERNLAAIGGARVVGSERIAKISLVGVGMRSHAGIASRMFGVMAREGINVNLVSTSEIKISVAVDEKYLELGVRALHEAFGLDKEPVREVHGKQ
ncbi:MAG: aspartate kinase [Xanthomonadaceae bacterium]|nr:aspartate kinase [Xanthomonadaceae bacterium]